MVIALAGRRIDAPQSPNRLFPPENIPVVRERLRNFFVTRGASLLVASAACGADLLALDEARALGLRIRVVLPCDPQRFRKTSVVDRPGDWGRLYDRIIAEATPGGEVISLMPERLGEVAYAAANRVILDEAASFAPADPGGVAAAIVWNGVSRGGSDLTQDFADEARRRGLHIFEISTTRDISQIANG